MKYLCVVLVCSALAFGQTHQHAPPTPEPRVDLAKLPPPQRIDGVGRNHIPITTTATEAQQWFDQGLSLLHACWDYEALRAFEQCLRLDPEVGMCHWGVAQALGIRGGRQQQIEEELRKANELAAKASD